MVLTNGIIHECFNSFDVYKLKENHAFLHVDFKNENIFYKSMADYIINENNLLNYANRLSKINFAPNKKIYAKLYRNLGLFLNQELESLIYNEVDDELLDVLGEEYILTNQDGETLIQFDKIGKIGEFVFHLFLTEFMQLDCVIPKFTLTTDRNMSIFGIDTLFFDQEKAVIYFGESKVSKNIDNAIKLLKKSLGTYEHDISEEYRLVLKNEHLKINQQFEEIFSEHSEVCISFKDFIKSAEIKEIGVPIFIMHGNDNAYDIKKVLEKMERNIPKNYLIGLKTKYIVLSIPIIDKAKFVETVMKKIVEKSNEYERQVYRI